MGNRGWVVTFAGMGLNLTLGILYAWSMFSKQLTESVENGGFGWSKTHATLPYTIAIACFAIMMVPAGRLQDRYGPRIVATIGAILAGAGLIVASFATPEKHFLCRHRFRRFGGHRYRARIRVRHPCRGKVVFIGKKRSDHRSCRGWLRACPGLYCASF